MAKDRRQRLKKLVINRRDGEVVRLRVGGAVVWITLMRPRNRSGFDLHVEAPAEVEVLRAELVPADELEAA